MVGNTALVAKEDGTEAERAEQGRGWGNGEGEARGPLPRVTGETPRSLAREMIKPQEAEQGKVPETPTLNNGVLSALRTKQFLP